MPENDIGSMLSSFRDLLPALVRRFEGGAQAENADFRQAVQDVLLAVKNSSLSWSRLNQALHRCSEAGMSEGFFKYYFLLVPEDHPYPMDRVFKSASYVPPRADEILSLQQLEWGLRRFMCDAMLYWGNFRQGYRELRRLTFDQIRARFAGECFDTGSLVRRGAVREPARIPKDNRYLISEMACKTYEPSTLESSQHVQIAIRAFQELRGGGQQVTPSQLKAKAEELAKGQGQQNLFELMYEDASAPLEKEADVIALYSGQWNAFQTARESALDNTRIYLSFCNDLDVYVATSMRTRQDFREMADTCEQIFSSDLLKNKFHVRYFDPTLSAATHHEDKGMIECLMVKTAKVLVYFAQYKESFGKVSECAMALSQGKPVIILCPDDTRGLELYRFYRDAHPLTRLVELNSGVVNGAMITHKVEQARALLERLFTNAMEYDLARKEGTDGYYLLKERLTGSTVRVITDDRLLTETFWNNWHNVS